MHITRRELFEVAGLLALARPVAAKAADEHALDATAARAADAIRGYSAEGFHRTATRVDRASANHLLTLAQATRASAHLEPFELSQVEPVAAFVEIDRRRLDGLPMFDGTFTGADGVGGTIGPIDGDQPIAWTRIAPNGEAALRRMREGSRHAAIVAVTMGGHPGLCPVNAAWFNAPFGPPVTQISSEHLEAIEEAARAGREVRVVAHTTRRVAQAFNVVADVAGVQPELPPVCVMTPRSGWHANASERGGGLACWLETMRTVVAARGRPRTVRFVASSGHELGHLGLHDYLQRNPTVAREAFAWVHLGANIGTSTGDTGMTPSDDRLRAAALRAFAPHGLDTIRQSPRRRWKESRDDQRRAAAISFIGANASSTARRISAGCRGHRGRGAVRSRDRRSHRIVASLRAVRLDETSCHFRRRGRVVAALMTTLRHQSLKKPAASRLLSTVVGRRFQKCRRRSRRGASSRDRPARIYSGSACAKGASAIAVNPKALSSRGARPRARGRKDPRAAAAVPIAQDNVHTTFMRTTGGAGVRAPGAALHAT